jgi:hypothetical protein
VNDDNEPVRPDIVEALFDATQDPELSDEVARQMLLDATPAERRAVADLHGALADWSWLRARGLARALGLLEPWWYGGDRRPLGAILKTIPPDVADQALEELYSHGWGAEDGLPPRPGDNG